MEQMIWKIFMQGWIVLFGAILINFLFSALKIKTWYDFLKGDRDIGLSWIFMVLVYPFLLGTLVYLASLI
jgi:hypothetical protein